MKVFRLVLLLNSLFALLLSQGLTGVMAQSGDDWSSPVNLSRSGSATKPVITMDSDGTYHTLWRDEFKGLVSASGKDASWSAPAEVYLPLSEGDSTPSLLADTNGYVHAFWQAADEGLFHSRASTSDLVTSSAWTEPIRLSDSALDMDVSLDPDGNIQLAYIQPLDAPDLPAGVYHRTLYRDTTGWSSPALLYATPYFRPLELPDSNVDIATSASDQGVLLYLSWDNRPRERVYLAKSSDGGQTWSEPEEVDRTDPIRGSGNPLDIHVTAFGEGVLLVWQRLNPAGTCSQVYSWSGDRGSTWTEPKTMLGESPLCGQETQLLSGDNSSTILWTLLQNQINLIAWDWSNMQWSNPEIQYELASFNDPETAGLVTFSCQQPYLSSSNQLGVVGCDTGGGGDIWFLERGLNNLSAWFPSAASWSESIQLVSSQVELEAPILIAGPADFLHVLWSQASPATSSSQETSIYYLGKDQSSWRQPVEVIGSPNGSVDQPTAALDGDQRLLAAWRSVENGQIYFSWANASRANIPAEWSQPQRVSSPDAIARAPHILVSESGTIYITYAIPLNEGRGIYFVSSEDGGQTWSQPSMVFDAESAGWQMVDAPQTIQTPDGDLHALWVQRPVSGKTGTLGLYYSRSGDGGSSWSEAEEVTDTNVIWSQMAFTDQGSLYRNWQEEINTGPIIKYQHLNGTSWSAPESLSSFGESFQNARLALDPSGTLHLLQIVQGSTGRLILRHWGWDGERWSVGENIELGYQPNVKVPSIAATSSPTGKLSLIYSTKMGGDVSDLVQYGLSYTERSLDFMGIAPASQPPTQAALTPGPVGSPAPEQTATLASQATTAIQPTQTPDLTALIMTEPNRSNGNITSGMVVGIVLSGLIVAGVISYRLVKARLSA